MNFQKLGQPSRWNNGHGNRCKRALHNTFRLANTHFVCKYVERRQRIRQNLLLPDELRKIRNSNHSNTHITNYHNPLNSDRLFVFVYQFLSLTVYKLRQCCCLRCSCLACLWTLCDNLESILLRKYWRETLSQRIGKTNDKNCHNRRRSTSMMN